MTAIKTLCIALTALLFSASAVAFEPNLNDEMELDVARAILNIKKADPGIETFFENAAGYAVFPSVGKGGFVVGGAYGKGLVIVDNKVDGETTMTQATVGLQLGAQKYAQFIFFRDQDITPAQQRDLARRVEPHGRDQPRHHRGDTRRHGRTSSGGVVRDPRPIGLL